MFFVCRVRLNAQSTLARHETRSLETSEAREATQQPTTAHPEEQPAETSDRTAAEEARKKEGRGSFVMAPLPIVSPAIGAGIIPVLAYIFPFQAKDAASLPYLVAVTGLVTNNGSRAFALGTDITDLAWG